MILQKKNQKESASGDDCRWKYVKYWGSFSRRGNHRIHCLHVIYSCLFNQKLQLNLTDYSVTIAAIQKLGSKCQPGVALQAHPSLFFWCCFSSAIKNMFKIAEKKNQTKRLSCDNLTKLWLQCSNCLPLKKPNLAWIRAVSSAEDCWKPPMFLYSGSVGFLD